jgi:hypothetical protein
MLNRPIILFTATLIATLSLGGCPAILADETTVPGSSVLSVNVRAVPLSTQLLSPSAEVPLEMIDGLPFVEVTINGEGPWRFLLDTGAATSVVSLPVAWRYPQSLTAMEALITDSTADAIMADSILHISSLTLGGLNLSDFHAIALDLSSLSEACGVEVHGILGFPVFRDLLLTIDYPGQRILIDDTVLDAEAADVIPMALIDNHPFVDLTIGQSRVSALLDTGHASSLSLPADTPGIGFTADPMPWFSSVDLSGPGSRQIARLAEDLALGMVLWEQPIITVDGPDKPNLGSGFMSFFEVSFDQRSGLVRIVTQDGEPQTLHSPSVLTFGVQIGSSDEQAYVAEVLAGSPSDQAGLQAGDELLSINGLASGQTASAVASANHLLVLEVVRSGAAGDSGQSVGDEDVFIASVSRTVWVE